jgi:ABC-type tungstate transport system substrate-binding protein
MSPENKKRMTEFLGRISKQDIRNTMAVAWMVLSFVFVFKLLSTPIPAGNKDVVNTIAGLVIGQLVVIVAYYFVQSKTEVDQHKKDNE